MRKKNYKGRCEKRKLSKFEGVCKTYDDIQYAYADIQEADNDIREIRCNVYLEGMEYTFDFLCVKADSEYMVRKWVYGILDSSLDSSGLWYHYLWVEDEKHNFLALRKLLQEGKLDWREVDVLDLSYPILNMCSNFLFYDWIELADETEG